MKDSEIISNAVALLNVMPMSTASEKTIRQYEATAIRLAKLAQENGATGKNGLVELIKQAKKTTQINTWFVRRAALKHQCRTKLDEALATYFRFDRLRTTQHSGIDPLAAALNRVGAWSYWLECINNEPSLPAEQRKRRRSKRQDMRGLPVDWRERLLPRCPAYRHALLVGMVTGCRPAELAKGIRLSIEDNFLVVVIESVKVSKQSGQPWRQLAWPINNNSPLIGELAREVLNGLSNVKIKCPKKYSGMVSAAAKREWPRRTRSITPYCFRHQVASDMKAAGIDGTIISMALGHCVDRTRSRYGSFQQGKRGSAIVPARVEAPREVRQTRSSASDQIGDSPNPERP